MLALRNIIQDQIVSEFLFLTGLKGSDITIVCYVTFDYVTTNTIDCLHFDTLYSSKQYQAISLVNKKLSE